MLCHKSIGDLAVFAEGAGGADLVETHEARVARNVSRDYCCQPSSDPAWMRLGHSPRSPSPEHYAGWNRRLPQARHKVPAKTVAYGQMILRSPLVAVWGYAL